MTVSRTSDRPQQVASVSSDNPKNGLRERLSLPPRGRLHLHRARQTRSSPDQYPMSRPYPSLTPLVSDSPPRRCGDATPGDALVMQNRRKGRSRGDFLAGRLFGQAGRRDSVVRQSRELTGMSASENTEIPTLYSQSVQFPAWSRPLHFCIGDRNEMSS